MTVTNVYPEAYLKFCLRHILFHTEFSGNRVLSLTLRP